MDEGQRLADRARSRDRPGLGGSGRNGRRRGREMVGVRGFEPPTPCSQSRCATGLRHTPIPGAKQYTLRRTAPSTWPAPQQAPSEGHRAAPVADRVLRRGAHLPEARAERRVVEDRVVAEAVVSAG